jgi:hypothetical protein
MAYYANGNRLSIWSSRPHLVGTSQNRHFINILLSQVTKFLLQNHDPDEREHADAEDQIREVLIHSNYLSQKDIEICLGLDVESLADRPGIEGMRELHAALVEKYITIN